MISATLGICRDEVKTFYKHPQRSNIYQQVRYVKDFSTRWELESGHGGLDLLRVVNGLLMAVEIGSGTKALGFFFHWQQVGKRYRSLLKAWILLTFNSGVLPNYGNHG